MSPRTDYAALIIGSGPGIGSHVARTLASKRFNRVALVARNQTQLEKDAKFISTAIEGTIAVRTYSADITNVSVFENTLAQVYKDLGTPEFILFNPALIRPSLLLEYSEEDILQDLKISTIALHIAAKWAIPHLATLAKEDKSTKPTLMVTTSHLPEQPIPTLFSLSLAKAAQKTLTRCLRMQYESQGIHICLLTVAGIVADTNPHLNSQYISEKAWELFNQDKDSWTEDMRIEDP